MAALAQADVWKDFNTVIPAEVKQYLLPVIVGPQGELHRYTDPTEKLAINVGAYNNASPTSYPWPGKSAEALVELDTVAVFIDNALLNYFTQADDGTITPVGGFPNRIVTSATDGFKANGVTYPRDATLGDRDVQIGDVVHIKHSTDELYTTVRSLVGDVIPASIDAATPDAVNPGNQSFTHSTVQTAGTVNDVSGVESASGYDGVQSGFINETYTVLVSQGSVGGDATTAKVQITSGSGTDNQANVTPAAFGTFFNLGTRGAQFKFTHTTNDLIVGQTFLVSIAEAFTKPVATSGGTYTGSVTQTYIISVITGGNYTDPTKPQIAVVSDLGIDMSGPTNVTAAATNVPVGTQGVLVQFSGTALRKGDKYYIIAVGPGVGAYKTIELNNNMSAALQADPSFLLELSLRKNIQVPQESSTPPDLNWTDSQAGLTLAAGIVATDPSFTNGGVQFSVPVISGPAPAVNTAVYISYIAYATAWCSQLGQLSDPTLVAGVLGPTVPENPLSYAVWKTLLNSNGQPVSFVGICDPTDLTQWQAALDGLQGVPVANVVVLTFDQDVNLALQAHVDQQSQQDVGGWRHGWGTLQAADSLPIVDEALSSDGNPVLATLSDDPTTPGTQYTYFTVTTGNSLFVTKGVKAGDIVRYLFTLDAFGNPTYSTFTVATVVNEETLIVSLPGNVSAVSVAQKFEVWRNQDSEDITTQLVAQTSVFKDKQMRMCWPDKVDTPEGSGLPGYFLTAALAGFVAGVAPHQGIETIALTGFTAAPRSTLFLNNGELIELAAGGVFVSSSDSTGVWAKFARTTDQTSADTKYEGVIRNDDAIQSVIRGRIAQFFGIGNLTQGTIVSARSEAEAGFFMLESQTFINNLDNMVLSHTITDVRQSTVSPDELIIQATVERPMILGQLQLTLVFTDPTATD